MSARKQEEIKQSALMRVLRATSERSAQVITYTAAILGLAALIPSLQLPPELGLIAGGFGVEAMGAILDRVARGDDIPDDEIVELVNRAISESRIEGLLTKEDFFHAFEHLRKKQRLLSKQNQSILLSLQQYIVQSSSSEPELLHEEPELEFRPDQFPHRNWRAVNRRNWLQDIAEWFTANYEKAPDEVMRRLLDHVFDIIRNARDQGAFLNRVMDLGRRLRTTTCKEESPSNLTRHHQRILNLLEWGLHRQHSHLFMLPQIRESNLLNVPAYPKLLLSTKLLAAGHYKEASEEIQGEANGCPLAQYTLGHSARKEKSYKEALEHLEKGEKVLEAWDMHLCCFDEDMQIICNRHLLEAAVLRAKGVLYRKLGDPDEAEKFYNVAAEAADEAIQTIVTRPEMPSKSELTATDTIWADYERDSAYRVKADVHFSHGYYWYARRKYERAESLFEAAIEALELADEEWDSPYTRLAVIKLCRGHSEEAALLFEKARQICKRTPLEKNREAPLSLALCTLGLGVIEICCRDVEPRFNDFPTPLIDLEDALNKHPRLAFGPLECHRDDAKHLLIDRLKAAQKLVDRFIDRLEREIDDLVESKK